MFTKIKNLILGAGPTGMYLAKRLEDPTNTIIVSQNVGGLLNHQMAVGESGAFIFDYGGHVYTDKDERTELLMQRSFAERFDRTNMVFYLRDGHDFIEFPVQNHVEVKPLEDMLLEFSLKEWAINRFGYDFYNSFFEPFNERVWTTDPANMAFNWISDRVSTSKDKNWGPNATFYYAPGYKIIQAMQYDIQSIELIKGTVVDINPKEKIVYVLEAATDKVGSIVYESLFDTTIKQRDYVNKCLFFGVGLKNAFEFKPFYWIYPDVKSPIHRITWLSRYYKGLTPEGCDSLLLEIPYRSGFKRKHGTTINQKFSDLSRIPMVSDMLKAAGLPVNQRDIEVALPFTSFSYPIPHLDVRKKVEVMKHIGLNRGVYYAGRWGSHGYFNLQHIWQDVDSVIEQLGSPKPVPKYIKSNFYYKDKDDAA